MDVDELPLLAAGIRRAGEVEKSGPAEDSVFRGGCSSYPADVMRPPKRCSSDFTSKKPAKLGMNEDVFPSLICEEKVDTPYLGHEVKPTLFSLNHEGSGGKSMKKSGTLPCAKRLRTEQPDDSMNIDGFDDLKSTATQIGSETNQFPCPEKSEMVKKKRRRDGSKTDKKSNKASTRSKYESFLSKTGFSCSDSVSGGNTIPGTYGLKSDLRVVDDLSLNELLDGRYKYANLRPAKGKKASNMNDNLLLSVRKALSVLSPPGAVDSNTKASLCLAQPNSYSSVMSESDEMDKHIEGSVPSSKVEDVCQANSGVSILYQPKVVLEKLTLPLVNDLDALLNLSISSPPLQSTNNVTTLDHASLPPFSWSVNHNGLLKPSVDCSKQASSRNISHGKWLRIGNNSAYSGDYQSSFPELQLKRSDHNEVSMTQQKIDVLLQDVKNLTAPAHRLFDEASDSRAMTGPSSVHIPDNTRMLNLLEDVGSSDGHRESVSKGYTFLGNSASDVTPRSGGSGPHVVQLSLNIGVKDGKMVQEQHTGGTHGCSDSYSYSCRSAPGGCDQNSLHLPAPETWKSGHSPRATCAADILCEMKRKSRSKASRSNTSGKTKWPKAPSQKTMKARKSPSSAEKTEKPYRSGDRYNPSPPSVKHKLVSEKNGVAHKNTTVREPIRPPAPVEHGESSARMERDLGVQPRSLHMNPVRKTVEAWLYTLHPHRTPISSSLQSTPYINGALPIKTLFLPSLHLRPPPPIRRTQTAIISSLMDSPVLWAGRLCVFYALLKAGLAGSPSNPIVSSEMGGGNGDNDDLGFSKWMVGLRGRSDYKEASDKRKLVSKWHPTTKGTLRRNYRVPSKADGSRLLKAIASLLSEDDHFVDATSHKGCQIRRQSAHGEVVCCNNVRALFDELPTPHLVIEITAFPAGSLTDNDYVKAEKLERVLRSAPSI